jgi:hypothetical protein
LGPFRLAVRTRPPAPSPGQRQRWRVPCLSTR